MTAAEQEDALQDAGNYTGSGPCAPQVRDRFVTRTIPKRHAPAIATISRDLTLVSIDETFSPNQRTQESQMKSIAKVLAPAVLALASLSAHAGVF